MIPVVVENALDVAEVGRQTRMKRRRMKRRMQSR